MSASRSAHRSAPDDARSSSRRCVSCRETAPRAELIRIVRRPSGELVVDSPSEGRGAYLHRGSQCIAAASSGPKLLARALRGSVPEPTLSEIAELTRLP